MNFFKNIMLTLGVLCFTTTAHAEVNPNAELSVKNARGTPNLVSFLLVENDNCLINIKVNGQTRWSHGCDTTNLVIFNNNRAMVQLYQGNKLPYALGLDIVNVNLNNATATYRVNSIYAADKKAPATGTCYSNLDTASITCDAKVVDGNDNLEFYTKTSGGPKHFISNN